MHTHVLARMHARTRTRTRARARARAHKGGQHTELYHVVHAMYVLSNYNLCELFTSYSVFNARIKFGPHIYGDDVTPAISLPCPREQRHESV